MNKDLKKYSKPLVSIILSTHNREEEIGESIKSVLSQTYEDFEFIIVDDGSSDNTLEVLNNYGDPRIKIIENKENIGFVKSLDKAINYAQGKYIARIDDDDHWINKEKLQKQIKFLEENSEYALIGTGMIKDNKNILLPQTDKQIREKMLLRSPFAHASVVFSKKAWQKVGGYDEGLFFSQDSDLWAKIGKTGKMYNLPEAMVNVSMGENNRTNKKVRYHLWLKQRIRVRHRKDYPHFWKAYILGFIDFLWPSLKKLRFLINEK